MLVLSVVWTAGVVAGKANAAPGIGDNGPHDQAGIALKGDEAS